MTPLPLRPPPLLADVDIGALAMFIGIGLLLATVYFLPGLIAGARNHPNAAPIFLVNLLLGWTVLGWIIALVWAFMAIESRRHTIIVYPPPLPRPRGRQPGSDQIQGDFDFDD